MGWESFGVVEFDLGSLFQGQTGIGKLRSAYNSLVIGPRGLGWYTNMWEIMCWESSGVLGFDLGPLVQGQTRKAKLKVLISRLLSVPEIWDGTPMYRK